MKEAYALTPDGMVDDPFIYVFDGRSLTDAGNPRSIVQQIDGQWDFLLRRVANASSLLATAANGGGIRLHSFSTKWLQSDLFAMGPNYTMAPQLLYPRNSEIGFDIDNVLRQVRINCAGTNILTPFLCFQGVRRHEGSGSFAAYEGGYQYYERPYTYTQDLVIDYAAFSAAGPPIAFNPPRVFNQEISDYDFELQQIRIVRPDGVAITSDELAITLYDASGFQRTSNRPIPIGVINANQGGAFFSMWPCPTLVYPVNTNIKFEVESFLCAGELNRTYEINFIGTMRIPE